MKNNFTHYAWFYGIPCYFNVHNNDLMGRNSIYRLLLDLAVWIEQKFPSNDEGFPILLGEEIEYED